MVGPGTRWLLIDVQRNMLEPPFPVPEAASVSGVIADVLERARAAGAHVEHVRNAGSADDPDAPGTTGWELVHEPRAGEPVVDKGEPDAFAGTDLDTVLPDPADLVVAGMQSDFCVRATSLAALHRGHRVTLVRGGHATYGGGVPAAAASRQVEAELAAAGAELVAAREVTFG